MMRERGGVVFSPPPGVGGERSICEPGDPGVEQNWKGRVISALPSPGKVYMVAK
ncbi:MAG: hypothetical protein J7K08_01860 [Thermoplasmata archaeon]|nr:hypothetical protein [Thermoplasmata archaeon]